MIFRSLTTDPMHNIKIHSNNSGSVQAHTTHWQKLHTYRGADKSLARPGRKQVTATEDFDFHISYL